MFQKMTSLKWWLSSIPPFLQCKKFHKKSEPHPLFFLVARRLCLILHPLYPSTNPPPHPSPWTLPSSEHSFESGSDASGIRSRSEGLFGQTTEAGETDKILNKWDNHNAIARGWGGVKENYHPVTFRGIYNVDSQKNFTTQNLWQVIGDCNNWS